VAQICALCEFGRLLDFMWKMHPVIFLDEHTFTDQRKGELMSQGSDM